MQQDLQILTRENKKLNYELVYVYLCKGFLYKRKRFFAK